MPFHVRITTRSQPGYDEIKLDLSEERLEEQFLKPYTLGRPIVIGGRVVPPDDLDRMRITFTDQTSEQLRPFVLAEIRSSGFITTIPIEWEIAAKGRDVTDEFITGPPGGDVMVSSLNGETPRDPQGVFVVHGRNTVAKEAVFAFLRSLDLHPMEWGQILSCLGKTAPYIGEVLDYAFSQAQAVVVIMSPDETARLKDQFIQADDSEDERGGAQPRPNVLIEAGMALGKHANRTIIVEIGKVRQISDILGRHAVKFSDSPQSRNALASKLKIAGCKPNTDGDGWLSAGDFKKAIKLSTGKPVRIF